MVGMTYRIRYIAGIAENPDKLAQYYRANFGLRELGRSPEGDVSLTDGFYNLTFLKKRPGLDEEDDGLGLNHFGIEIDDIREIESRLEEFAPRADIRQEKGDLHPHQPLAAQIWRDRRGAPDAAHPAHRHDGPQEPGGGRLLLQRVRLP